MRRLIVLALLLLSTPAWATTFWMCPTGKGAGATDGTSQGNCCDGVGDVSCQTPAAGDTVKLVGAFSADDRLVVPVAGTAGSPITYQCQAGTTIRGSREISQGFGFNNPTGAYEAGHPWALVAGTTDIYKQTGAFIPHFLREDGVLLTPTVHYLDGSDAAAIAGMNRGEYTQRNGTPKIIYYRATNGTSPDAHSLLINASDLATNQGMILISGKNYITIDSCDIADLYTEGTSPGGAIYIVNSTGTVVKGGSQSNSLSGITIDGGSLLVDGTSSHDNYTANITAQGLTANTSVFEVKNSTIYNAHNLPLYTGQFLQYTGDGDGIGIGENGGTVTLADLHDNYIYNNGPIVAAVPAGTTGDLNRGSCITLSTSAVFTATNVMVKRNYCYNNARYGILIGGGATPTTQNVYVEGNIIQRTRGTPTVACSTTQQSALRIADQTAGTGYRRVVNNDLIDNGSCVGMYMFNDTAGTTWDIFNNVSWSNAGTADGLSSNAGELWMNNAANTNFNEGSNKFGASAYVSVSSRLYKRGTTNYANVAAWVALGIGVGVGDAIITDPGWASGTLAGWNSSAFPLTAAGFRLKGTSGLRWVCKDLNVGNVQDNGNRAFLHPPSCGAWEATSGDAAPARLPRQ